MAQPIHSLLVLEVHDRLHGHLVDRLRQVEHLQPLLVEPLQEGRLFNSLVVVMAMIMPTATINRQDETKRDETRKGGAVGESRLSDVELRDAHTR